MLDIFTLILLFFTGAAFGSFLSVVIDRLPRGEAFFSSRSHCEKCKKQLKWYDLLPVVSYLALRGRCRRCHAQIPIRLFLVEFFSGLLLIYLFQSLLSTTLTSFLLPFTLFLIILSLVAIFLIDARHGIIPDVILLVLLSLITVFHLTTLPPIQLLYYVGTGLGSFGAFLALFILTRGRGMGFGDVKFAFVIGYFLGWPGALFALYLSFLSGGIISLLLIVTGKKKLRRDTIPFGPFLVLGTLLAYFFKSNIAQIVFFYL